MPVSFLCGGHPSYGRPMSGDTLAFVAAVTSAFPWSFLLERSVRRSPRAVPPEAARRVGGYSPT